MQLMHITQLIALYITVKGLENFQYARQYRLNILNESKASEQNVKAFKLQCEEDVSLYKTRTIKKMIAAHGGFFNHLVQFEDWNGAMKFLEKNRQEVINLIMEEWND